MRTEFKIKNKTVRMYCNTEKENIPLVVLNHFGDDTDKVYAATLKAGIRDFILVTVSDLEWNTDLSPYPIEKVFKNDEDFKGGADTYLKLLTDEIMPVAKAYIQDELKKSIENSFLAGYSLAGLFAVYACYKTDLFNGIISASGSMWYPGFMDFIRNNTLKSIPEGIYLSLGNKESRTRNEIMASVGENTKAMEEYYKAMGIKTIYEENEGNHFNNPEGRIAKGIKWILK